MDIKITRKFQSSSQENIHIDDIKSIIRKALGDKREITSIETSKNGNVNSCYVITAGKPTDKYFLKIENHDLIPKFYSGQIEREHACIELFRKHGLPSPVIVACDITKTDIGKKYILTKFVEGRLLSDVWCDLTISERRETKEQVIALVEGMKNIKNPYFGDTIANGNRGKFKLWNDAYLNLSSILLKDCVSAGLLDNYEQEVIKGAIYKSAACLSSDYEPCFNHMDFHWQNILIDRSKDSIRINAILDFGNSMFGLPFTDQYRLNNFLFLTEQFYDSDTPKKYCISKDELFSCQLLHCLEFLVFEGMVKESWGYKPSILLKSKQYLSRK